MTDRTPYDPSPDREDAFADLARQGFAGAAADHAARLNNLRAKVRGQVRAERRASRRRWWAPAAAAGILALIGSFWVFYPTTEAPLARKPEPPSPEVMKDVAQVETATRFRESSANEELNDAPALAQSPVTESQAKPVAATQTRAEPSPAAPAKLSPALSKETASPQEEGASVAHVAELVQEDAPIAQSVDEGARSRQSSLNSAPEQVQKKRSSRNAEFDASVAPQAVEQQLRMERGENAELRRFTGTLRAADTGDPVRNATVHIEGVDLEIAVDAQGDFSFDYAAQEVIVQVTSPGTTTAVFAMRADSDYRVVLPLGSVNLPTVRNQRTAQDVVLLAPLAPTFADFERYVDAQQQSATGEQEVMVAFGVAKDGRPKNIRSANPQQTRQAVRAARELLLQGPPWPSSYRKQSWRYAVRLVN